MKNTVVLDCIDTTKFIISFLIISQVLSNDIKTDDILTSAQIAYIQQLSANYPEQDFDAKFIGQLLGMVFGNETLKQSSAQGKKSRVNGKCHNALDQNKLFVVKCKLFVQNYNLNGKYFE